jgi:hypothetical protein
MSMRLAQLSSRSATGTGLDADCSEPEVLVGPGFPRSPSTVFTISTSAGCPADASTLSLSAGAGFPATAFLDVGAASARSAATTSSMASSVHPASFSSARAELMKALRASPRSAFERHALLISAMFSVVQDFALCFSGPGP